MFPILTTISFRVSPALFASTRATIEYCRLSALVVPVGGTRRVKMVATAKPSTQRKGWERPVFRATSLELPLIGPPQIPTKAAVVCPSLQQLIRRALVEGKCSGGAHRRVHRR